MMQEGFDWTDQRLDLLNELLHALSGLVDEWENFVSPNGDIGYFRDLDEAPSIVHESPCLIRPSSSLRNIKQAFERLEMHRRKLQFLKESLITDFEVVRSSRAILALVECEMCSLLIASKAQTPPFPRRQPGN
jgi:hypothetical protein